MDNNLIMEYQNLIFSISHYFKNYPNKEDLFQVGCIGLIKAYRNFKSDNNTKFSTYAYSYILGEMKSLIRQDSGIKISRDITKLNLQIERATIILAQELSRLPTTCEIADYLNKEEFLIIEAINSKLPINSMDEVISSDTKDLCLQDTIADSNYKTTDIETLLTLKNEIDKLSPLEKKLIELRYMDDLTQSEVAKQTGISQVQVSRNENKVLVKLKTKLHN